MRTPNGTNPSPLNDDMSIDETLRSMVRHENDLINQRMGWLLQLQGFLFAALAFGWDQPGA